MRVFGVLSLTVILAACGRVALVDDRDAGSAGGMAAGGVSGGSAGGTGGGSAAGSSGGTAGGASGGLAGGSAGGSGGGAANPCTGLSVSACRADARCTPDFCFQCSCEPRFAQCRLRSAPAFMCPQFGCPQPMCCSDDSTCGRPLICLRPDQQTQCGTCNTQPSTCTNDASCPSGSVCLTRRCACSGETDCQPGCGPMNPCARGETCNPMTLRCEDQRCSAASPCPSGMDCILGPMGNVCRARACTRDGDCGDVFCVSGFCAPGLGVCGQIPP